MIPQKMKSTTEIVVEEIDMYSVINLVARIKQGDNLLEKPLTVVGSHEAILAVTRADAEQFNEKKPLEVQILWEDEYGMPDATKIKTVPVDRVIGGGYGD